jgi:hypothetical protein
MVKPAKPRISIGLRPNLLAFLAQNCEVTVQASAESEKVLAMRKSGIAKPRPIAGMIETNPRFPIAVSNVTKKSM